MLLLLRLLLLPLVSGLASRRHAYYDYDYRDRGKASPRPPPRDAMVDVANDLGLALLAIHNEDNENNIAISPYGALSVIIALIEGLQGDAVHEILHAAHLPHDRSIIRVGLRDIHRHLKSYFIPDEGFLSGLILNHDNVTLKDEYEEVLKFYGYSYAATNNSLHITTQSTIKEATTIIPSSSTGVHSRDQIDDNMSTTIPAAGTPKTTTSAPTTTIKSEKSTTVASSITTSVTSTTRETITTTTNRAIVTQQETTSQSLTSTTEPTMTTQAITEKPATPASEATTISQTTTPTTVATTIPAQTTTMPTTTMQAITEKPTTPASEATTISQTTTPTTVATTIQAQTTTMPTTMVTTTISSSTIASPTTTVSTAGSVAATTEEKSITTSEQPTPMPTTMVTTTTSSTTTASPTTTESTSASVAATTEKKSITTPEQPTTPIIPASTSTMTVETNSMRLETTSQTISESPVANKDIKTTTTKDSESDITEVGSSSVATTVGSVLGASSTTDRQTTTEAISLTGEEGDLLSTNSIETTSQSVVPAFETFSPQNDLPSEQPIFEQPNTPVNGMDTTTGTEPVLTTVAPSDETTPYNPQNTFDYSYYTDPGTQTYPEAFDTSTMTESDVNANFTVAKKRTIRSVVDYIIARAYDDHQYRPAHNYYIPEEPLTFLVYGQYREPNVSFMRYDTVLPFYFISNLDAMALSFPLDSTKYYLLLLLPVDEIGIDKLICDLRLLGSLKYVIQNLEYTHVVATIPSFMLKGHVVLTRTFQKLGIRQVFEPRQADFSPMTHDKGIYVTNIEQAVTVTIRNYVDPRKKESFRSLRNYEPVHFKADHPFLYFVIDSELQITLMAGKVVNPLNTRIR